MPFAARLAMTCQKNEPLCLNLLTNTNDANCAVAANRNAIASEKLRSCVDAITPMVAVSRGMIQLFVCILKWRIYFSANPEALIKKEL